MSSDFSRPIQRSFGGHRALSLPPPVDRDPASAFLESNFRLTPLGDLERSGCLVRLIWATVRRRWKLSVWLSRFPVRLPWRSTIPKATRGPITPVRDETMILTTLARG
jgi:hypothetical protein